MTSAIQRRHEYHNLEIVLILSVTLSLGTSDEIIMALVTSGREQEGNSSIFQDACTPIGRAHVAGSSLNMKHLRTLLSFYRAQKAIIALQSTSRQAYETYKKLNIRTNMRVIFTLTDLKQI